MKEALLSKKQLLYFFPIILMILANFAYTLVQKVTPTEVDPFASVSLTYTVCIVYSFVMFFITRKGESYPKALKNVNWTAPALGLCLVTMETSTLLMFRFGWDISVGSIMTYVLLAVVLVFVGALFYKEKITSKRVLGIAICLIGVALVTL